MSVSETEFDYEFLLPAGDYWIGDPCYAFSNSSPKSGEWGKVLENTDFFANPHCDLPEIQIWAGNTAYGDGSYIGSDGNTYPVDAGLIGIMPIATIDYLQSDKTWLTKSGKFVTYSHPFMVKFDRGNLTFGNLNINTVADDYDDYGDDE